MPRGRVTVGARGAARIDRGLPWIFRADVSLEAELAPGQDDVDVVDERGRLLGSALFAPAPAPIALRVYARGERIAWDDFWPERLGRAAARRGGAPVCRLAHGEA